MKLGADVRTADAAVWHATDAGVRSGRVRSVPPILAVEVAGEDEEERVLEDKARWYLERGVSVVWLVLPESREVIVISSTGKQRFGREERLPVTDVLPGLAPEVARFFAQLDR